MKIDRHTVLTELAGRLPAAASVFELFGIDYSCAGPLTLEDACWSEGLDPDAVIDTLTRLDGERTGRVDDRPIRELLADIGARQQSILHHDLPAIARALAHACQRTSAPEPLRVLRDRFALLAASVMSEFAERDRRLVPRIEALQHGAVPRQLKDEVRRCVIANGHLSEMLRSIREVRRELRASEEATDADRALIGTLERLEASLHELMFLENCVLLPQVVMRADDDTAACGMAAR
jgi:iron-sulfur cluster repair protein YtfE (RIC family)